MEHANEKRIAVDIGIPALNEELNIRRMLQSIGMQRQVGYHIERIILLSDGSTDKTVEYAKSLKLPSLQVIENPKREGLAKAWHSLLHAAKADVLILLDADIELSNKHVLAELVKPFIEDPTVSLTSGRSLKQSTNSFTDSAMNVSVFLQDYIKSHFKHGHSVYACLGRIIAVRRSIVEKMPPPQHVLGNDAYLYLFNKTYGGEFVYTPNATVRSKAAQTFEDFSKQAKRFMRSKHMLADIFGDWIYDEYKLPKTLMLRSLLSAFCHNPFYTVVYVCYQLRFRLFSDKSTITAKDWQTSSTKNLE